MKKIMFIFATLLIFFGCRDRAELSMERGEYFYNIGKLEDAVLEYKKVINSFPNDISNIDFDNIQMLANAHHNLAVTYAKKKWYTDAVGEARKAFDLFPTDANRKVLELIQKKEPQKTSPKPTPIDPANR